MCVPKAPEIISIMNKDKGHKLVQLYWSLLEQTSNYTEENNSLRMDPASQKKMKDGMSLALKYIYNVTCRVQRTVQDKVQVQA